MKKVLLGFSALTLLLTSCGSKDCDVTTAEGTAKCYCELTEEYEAAKEADDEKTIDELKDKMDKFKEEAEKHMEAGDYSENDVEKLINETCEAH